MKRNEQISLQRKICKADRDVMLGLATLIHGTCEKAGVEADIRPPESLGVTIHTADTPPDTEKLEIDSLAEPIPATLGALSLMETESDEIAITVQVVSAELVDEVQSLGSVALPGVAKLSLATISRHNAPLVHGSLYQSGLATGIHGIPITLQEAHIA